MPDSARKATQRLAWTFLRCRFDCDSPVVGVYLAPQGCICWPDKLQALCAQHAIKGRQNNNMLIVFERVA